MTATLRRQHGGGRDFLQENKLSVSRMDTNGRCLAAASARQVPMWRPVVLHYAEKLRPHFPISQRQPRQAPAATDVRSGLAQPYMESGVQRRATTPPCGCELTKRRHAKEEQQVRLQGGWVDPRRKERPVRRCCHQNCHCNQVQQPAEVPVPVSVQSGHEQPHLRLGEGDQAERMSQCSSKISQRFQKERFSAGEENAEPEAPLSARSSASAVTLKTKRSVSQESRRSNVTVKSSTTVASQNTIASKKSQMSRRSRNMEVMPPPEDRRHERQHERRHEQKEQQQQPAHHEDFEGYTPLTQSQKQAALDDAQFKYGKLMEEYNHLPVSVPTLRVRSRKIAIEKQLDELDYAINMFDQPNMDMYYKR